MASLELKLLGGFEARLKAERALDLPTKKTRLLLSFLALPPGQAHPRKKLASLLWGDRADAQAQHSLRQSLLVLRKRLAGAESPPVRADRRTISLDPLSVTVDVARFENLLASGTHEALQQACVLYRGELLEGENLRDPLFEEWLFYERRRYHDLALNAFEQLLNHHRAAKEPVPASETAQRLLTLSPAHEKAHRALMAFYAGQGRRATALEQYEHCRAALERELAVKPERETERLYRDILQGRGEPPETPPAPKPRPQDRAAPELQAANLPEQEAFARPEKPSVAVLPFVNMSGDPGQDYFCDGITEDIITNLSRFRSLFVISRHSSFSLRDLADDLRQVGRKLGVGHIVEGSVQRSGKRIRITVQLIEVQSGHHIWAERYDRELENIFTLQDEVTSRIAGHVTKRIDDRRLDEARRRHPESLQAYDHWLQAKQHLETRSSVGIVEGRRLLVRALQLDPYFARAYADLSRAYLNEAHYSAGGTERQDKTDKAFRTAQKAVSLDDTDSWTLVRMGWAHLFRREFRPAISHFELAASFNPSDADTLMLCAQGHAYAGDPATGIDLANRALRLNPYPPEWYRVFLVCIYFLACRYEDSLEASRHSPELQPDVSAWKAAACARLDRLDEARSLVNRFVQNVQAIWVGETPPDRGAYRQHFINVNPLARQEDMERLLNSLRQAGLPE